MSYLMLFSIHFINWNCSFAIDFLSRRLTHCTLTLQVKFARILSIIEIIFCSPVMAYKIYFKYTCRDIYFKYQNKIQLHFTISNLVNSNTPLFQIQTHFPSAFFQSFYYQLFWTPAILNCLSFPLGVQNSEVQPYWKVFKKFWKTSMYKSHHTQSYYTNQVLFVCFFILHIFDAIFTDPQFSLLPILVWKRRKIPSIYLVFAKLDFIHKLDLSNLKLREK